MAITFNNLKSTTIGMDDVLDFGSWRGHTVEEIIKIKPSYIRHLVDNTDTYQKYFYESVMEALELAKYTQKKYNTDYHGNKYFFDGTHEKYHYPDHIVDAIPLSDYTDWDDDIPF